MTFKQIKDSFNKRFYDLRSSLNVHHYKFDHLELDSESSYFEYDSAHKKEYAIIIWDCYRDLVALSSDVDTFRSFATKDSEKEVLWNLRVEIDDYCYHVSDYVYDVRCMYHWDY